MNEIEQKKIINYCRNYILKNRKNTLVDPNIFFCTFSHSIGYFKLKLISKFCYENLIKFVLYRIANIYHSLNVTNYQIINLSKKCTNKIFITYGQLKDFDKYGNFYDRYFTLYNKKKFTKIIIYLDKNLPKKINSNLILLKARKGNIFKTIYTYLKLSKFNFSKLKFFSYETMNGLILNEKLKYILKNFCNIKIANILYESQNFNLQFIKTLKEKNITVYGHIHSILPALPTNMIYKEPSPDKIIVSGKDNFQILKKLGWNKNKIKEVQSIRFFKKKKIDNNFFGYLFFPIQITNYKFYENIIIKFFNLNKKYNFKIRIKEHPSSNKNYDYIKFKNKINFFLKKISHNQPKNISFFIGSTSSVIEALERGVNVIHFADNPILQKYESFLFKNIIIKELMPNVFSYKLIKKNSYIRLNNSQNLN